MRDVETGGFFILLMSILSSKDSDESCSPFRLGDRDGGKNILSKVGKTD